MQTNTEWCEMRVSELYESHFKEEYMKCIRNKDTMCRIAAFPNGVVWRDGACTAELLAEKHEPEMIRISTARARLHAGEHKN